MPGEKLTPIPRNRKAKVQAPAPAAAATVDPARIGETKIVPLADLAFLADNPMDHSDQEVEEFREILRRRGQLAPLVVNRRPVPPVVVGGNKRLRAMLAENWQTAAVIEVDLAEDDAAALAIELNATQGQDWNAANLQKALQAVGKLALGEKTEALFARLAEAKKLIPPAGAVGNPADDPDPRHRKCIEVICCQRCGQNHDMIFRPLSNPANEYAWWAMCPVKREPLLLAFDGETATP